MGISCPVVPGNFVRFHSSYTRNHDDQDEMPLRDSVKPNGSTRRHGYPTILELIGHTPLVRLQRIAPPDGPTLLAKLEFMNPGGSVKDRKIGRAHV